MASNPKRPEEESTDDYPSEPNTDVLSAISALPKEAGETMLIQTLQRFAWPIFEPLIRKIVKEELEVAKRNPEIRTSTSVPKKLKLQFRNRIALPVFSGMPLLGENRAPIEVALVDALTEQIVNTGTESTAKLKIMAFRVGDDNSCTSEDFQARILSEKKGRRILQGNTRLQLMEGIGLIDKLSFTHSSEHTKNGSYRLVATVVDAALTNRVEVAWTETFLMKDRRCTYHEKHPHPYLSDKVSRLKQIGSKGTRFKHLKDSGVITVKDLLTLLYMDQKQLEHILELKASSKYWDEIIKSAHASNAVFLYLDPSNNWKTGVVLDVKLQLKALIAEPQHYIPVNQLSDQQKVGSQNLVKFASENFKLLKDFEDEASLNEYLKSSTCLTSLPSANERLGTSKITDEPPTPSSQITYSSLGFTETMNNSTFHMGESISHAPTVTSQSQRGKEKVCFDDERVYSGKFYQDHISLIPSNLQGVNLGTATEPGTSSQAVESPFDICGFMNAYDIMSQDVDWEEFELVQNSVSSTENELHPIPANSDAMAQTRWVQVSKLLRQNSVRERISLSEGIQDPKRPKLS